jgi:hypothetical protein
MSRKSPAAGWPLLCAALGSSVVGLTLPMPARSGATPSGCTPIQSVPPRYAGINFVTAIEGIFTNFNGLGNGCADCHTTMMGTQTPPAGYLDLDPQDSPSPYANLINVPSYEDANVFYVVPNHPEQSLLFQKVNCDSPVVGVRMPYLGYPDGATTLTADQQALIYDWIAEGAPVGTTDGIFRDNFDMRGFAQ